MRVTISYLIGRAANGAERDGGHLWHGRVMGSYRAACGATPGARSAGWSEAHGGTVTCARCRAVLVRNGLPTSKEMSDD